MEHARRTALLAIAVIAGLGGAGDLRPAAPGRSRAAAGERPADAPQGIAVSNFEPGETIRYPVPLLAGTVDDAAAEEIVVTNRSSDRGTRVMKGIARKGRFKALAELVPGRNDLVLEAGARRLEFALVYKPQTNPRVVRAVYVTDEAGSTDYQTPLEDDPQDWRGKLETALLVMQTFTAEEMRELGYGRRTFNLEFDEAGRVKVHIVKLGESAEELLKRDGNWLFGAVYGAIERQLPRIEAKNVAVMGFTRFDPATKRALAHTALGGGDLGLFGGGGIFTWPNSIRDAQAAFADARMIDPAKHFSDSVGRHAYWANSSTCIGAALHELGHALGLPHSSHWRDIMTRGHDYLNRAFTLVEPPHAGRREPYEFPPEEEAAWMPVSAAALAPHRFLALDDREFVEGARTSVDADDETCEIVVTSELGLAYVAVEIPGKADFFRGAEPGGEAPKEMRFAAAELGRRFGTEDLAVRTIDTEGNHAHFRVKDVLIPFVRTWRFGALTHPWTDTSVFVRIRAEEGLAEATASAAAGERFTSYGPYVDFLPRFPEDKREHVAGYAMRRIYSEGTRRVRILTGSDDALRVWLNGERLMDRLLLRGAVPDSEWTDGTLVPGDNKLVVEVSQGLGGWGLYLRIVDDQGNPLQLTEADALLPWDASRIRRLLRGPFVTAWRFAPLTHPWTDRGRFVDLDAAKLEAVTASAAGAPLSTSAGACVDFLERFPEDKRANVAGYALRTVVSDEPRRVKLFTGSDDAIRVWVNGGVVLEKLALRGAKPDSESAVAELKEGENTLLVEVSQGVGGWALYLRMEDEEGGSLALDDDGKLAPLGSPGDD